MPEYKQLKPRKNHPLKVKLTDAEYAFFSEEAAKANKSFSQFVRDAMANEVNRGKTTDETTKIKVNLAALNQIGNNINQIAYSLNKLWYSKKITPIMYKKSLEELFTISTLLLNFQITKK